MIAGEPMYLDTLVGHHRQFAQEACEATRHHILELEPIVDDVAHQKELLAVVLNRFEETHYSSLVFQRILKRSGAKMAITDEIDLSH